MIPQHHIQAPTGFGTWPHCSWAVFYLATEMSNRGAIPKKALAEQPLSGLNLEPLARLLHAWGDYRGQRGLITWLDSKSVVPL